MDWPKDVIIAIDSGNRMSAYVAFEIAPEELGGIKIYGFGKKENAYVRSLLRKHKQSRTARLVVEMLKARGMPTSNAEFETCVEIGRFIECWRGRWTYAGRLDVKLYLCGVAKATDTNIRAALIDHFGGEEVAVGGKACLNCKGKGWKGRGRPVCDVCDGMRWATPPGPLHGVAADVWAALAVAVYWSTKPPIIHAWTEEPKKASKSKAKKVVKRTIKRKVKKKRVHGTTHSARRRR